VDRLTEALTYARQTTGEGYTFHWPLAFILGSLSVVTAAADPPTSRRWASALLDHAAAIGMREYTARAHRHLLTGARHAVPAVRLP
jgi:hypothetical protein